MNPKYNSKILKKLFSFIVFMKDEIFNMNQELIKAIDYTENAKR